MSENEIIEAVSDHITEMPEEDRKSLGEKILSGLYVGNSRKGVFDAIQEKLISRKLLVFLTATGLLAWSGLDSETWGLIAIVYIGGQAVIDAVKAWKGNI